MFAAPPTPRVALAGFSFEPARLELLDANGADAGLSFLISAISPCFADTRVRRA
jgi:hypothetical protein